MPIIVRDGVLPRQPQAIGGLCWPSTKSIKCPQRHPLSVRARIESPLLVSRPAPSRNCRQPADPREDRQKPSPGRVINMSAGHTRVVNRRPTFRPRRQQDPDLIASGAALAVGEIRTAPNEPPCCLNSRDPDAGYKHGDEDRPEADIAFHVRRISALSQLVTGSDQSTASVQVERSVGSVVDPACVRARSRPRVPPDSGSFIEKVDQGRDDHFACVTGYP